MSERLIKSYNRLFIELERHIREDDVEGMHSTRDKILKKFTRDMSTGKIDKISDARRIAVEIDNHIGQIKTQLWYA